MNTSTSTLRSDIALLIARLAIGSVFLAHGWQKFFDFGISGVQQSFAGMDIPLADISAWFVAIVEFGGGIALILGAATVVVGALLTVVAGGALVFVHIGNGFFVDNGGFELVLVLAAVALALALLGAGRWSVDGLLRDRRRVGTR